MIFKGFFSFYLSFFLSNQWYNVLIVGLLSIYLIKSYDSLIAQLFFLLELFKCISLNLCWMKIPSAAFASYYFIPKDQTAQPLMWLWHVHEARVRVCTLNCCAALWRPFLVFLKSLGVFPVVSKAEAWVLLLSLYYTRSIPPVFCSQRNLRALLNCFEKKNKKIINQLFNVNLQVLLFFFFLHQ